MTLSTSISLQELRDALSAHPPTHHDLSPGWASIENHESNLRAYDAAPPPSDPRLFDEDAYPERVIARLYFFVYDRLVERTLPNASEHRTHYLDAVDVIFTQHASGKILALCSTRNATDLGRVERALTEAALSVDDAAVVTTRDSLIAFNNADIFLWLSVQGRDQPILSPDWEILQIFDMSGTDSAWGTNHMRRDVNFARPAFLTAVAEEDTLGPTKIVLRRELTAAKLDIQLFQDGGFNVHVSRTFYRHIPVEEEMRLTAVLDTAFDFVPLVTTQHADDKAWDKTGRASEVANARAALRSRYA